MMHLSGKILGENAYPVFFLIVFERLTSHHRGCYCSFRAARFQKREPPQSGSGSCVRLAPMQPAPQGAAFLFLLKIHRVTKWMRCTCIRFSEVTPSMRMTEVLFNRAARIGAFLIAVAILLVYAPAARAAAGNTALKIYEVAGAGALSGASYPQDTIILYNPTLAPITCSTCAIQTHSGSSIKTTDLWTVYKLPVFTVPAGGFYAISASAPSSGAYNDPPPGTTSTNDGSAYYDYRLQTIETGGSPSSTQNILSSTVGAIALTNIQTALTSAASAQCGTGSQIVDFVGYGSNVSTNSTAPAPASCFAGSGPAYYDGTSAYGRQLGITRKNKCIDTF